MSHQTENDSQAKNLEWEKQGILVDSFLVNGVKIVVSKISDLDLAFADGPRILCCMDEGVPRGTMRSAGSGMLTEGDDRAVFLNALKSAGIEGVTSHVHCGAAGLYRAEHNITDKSVDEIAIENAKQIADELGVVYKGHLTTLDRPVEFHSARVVYYDGTGGFNPAALKEKLPMGFVVSRRYMSPKQAFSELSIALSISFGDHGFGSKFTSEFPLLIIPIADSTKEEFGVLSLAKELNQWLELISGEDRTRVKIDGFEM
jgi:hypothetical protein